MHRHAAEDSGRRAEHTGQPVEKISADTDRDFILTAEDAKAYGVVDEVVTVRQLEALGAGLPALGAAAAPLAVPVPAMPDGEQGPIIADRA